LFWQEPFFLENIYEQLDYRLASDSPAAFFNSSKGRSPASTHDQAAGTIVENRSGLSIGEAARVVALEVRGVVFLFEDGFPEQDEGPVDGDAIEKIILITLHMCNSNFNYYKN
jgi:hypothetical protein